MTGETLVVLIPSALALIGVIASGFFQARNVRANAADTITKAATSLVTPLTAELDRVSLRVKNLESDVADRDYKISQLEGMLIDREAKINELEVMFRDLLSQREARLAEMEQRNAEQTRTIDSLRKTIAKQENRSRELEKHSPPGTGLLGQGEK